MAAAVAEDCEAEQEKSEGDRSLNTVGAGNASAAPSPLHLAGTNGEEQGYEQAALAAAEELRLFDEQQGTSADESGVTAEGSGGFFVEDSSLSLGNGLNGEEDVACSEPKDVFTVFNPSNGQEKPNGECENHVEHAASDQLGAVAPSDRELAELLDDECPEATEFDLLNRKGECARTHNLLQPTIQPEGVIGSSLLDGTAGLAARRRAAEAASWCSQHQAADLYCLREQLLKEEAAAGRLRVRKQPNPHGEAFKPMRLYAIKEVEELAVRVWGSLEAAKAAKERRIEERWQRRKRSTLPRSDPPDAKKQHTSRASSEQRAVAAVPPIPRTKEDEWEEI
ncbi:hypothetical protein Emag_006084 [Eimeria magna]